MLESYRITGPTTTDNLALGTEPDASIYRSFNCSSLCSIYIYYYNNKQQLQTTTAATTTTTTWIFRNTFVFLARL